MKEYNFIDDRKYADMYIKAKQKNSGKNKIKYDLLKRGINQSIVDSVTESLTSECEEDSARVLAEKKYKAIIKREVDRRKIYEKLLRFLVSKGYTWELSKSVIEKVIDYSLDD